MPAVGIAPELLHLVAVIRKCCEALDSRSVGIRGTPKPHAA